MEHLDFYVRERLRPEFEEFCRPIPPKVAIPPDLSHPLVLKSEKLLQSGKLNQQGQLITKNAALAHILVSREQLPRALRIVNAMLQALEERGQPASWPKEEGASIAVAIEGEAVRLCLSEITDCAPHVLTPAETKHPWSTPKYDYKPTGRLQLQIANVPAFMGPIRRTWADGKQQRIENCIGDYIIGLSVAAAAIKRDRQETEAKHRQWEEERKREEEERRIAEEQKRKAEFVAELIGNWQEATRLRQFVKAIEETIAGSNFDAERNDVQKVLDWTKEYADSLDPLSDLPEAVEEFVRPESKYWWFKS